MEARDAVDLSRRRGDYGVDAPFWLVLVASWAVVWAVLAVVLGALVNAWLAAAAAVLAAYPALGAAGYLYTTRAGKFAVWAQMLEGLGLRGDERLLDIGCGRGAVLLMAAKLLPAGRAVGVDLWKTSDQSGNAPEVTEANARREGVADRVELHTGDMTALPFADASFDVVVSSMAIHNVRGRAARLHAVEEAARVLRPGGRILIADAGATARYADRLRELGLRGVARRPLGWRFSYGGPWIAVSLVTAERAPDGR
jgi:arsenite methyltransferase